MDIGNFAHRVLWTVLVLARHPWHTLVRRRVLVGVDANIQMHDQALRCYLSFSPEPLVHDYDDYGVPTGDIHYFLSGLGEMLSVAWTRGSRGWRLVEATTLYASSVDDL